MKFVHTATAHGKTMALTSDEMSMNKLPMREVPEGSPLPVNSFRVIHLEDQNEVMLQMRYMGPVELPSCNVGAPQHISVTMRGLKRGDVDALIGTLMAMKLAMKPQEEEPS